MATKTPPPLILVDPDEVRLTQVIVSSDPADPLLERYEFEPTPAFPVTALEVLGTKEGDTARPQTLLIHGLDQNPVQMSFDEAGLIDEVRSPDGVVYKIVYAEDEATVHVLLPSGEHGAVLVPLGEEVLALIDAIKRSAPEETIASKFGAGVGPRYVRAQPGLPRNSGPAAAAETLTVHLRGQATFYLNARDQDGKNIAALLQPVVTSTGLQHAFATNRLDTSNGKVNRLEVSVIHEVPQERIVAAFNKCETERSRPGTTIAIVGAIIGIAVSIWVGPIAGAEAMTLTEGAMASVAATAAGFLMSMGWDGLVPDCRTILLTAAHRVFSNQETVITIAPGPANLLGGLVESYRPESAPMSPYKPYGDVRPRTPQQTVTFVGRLRELRGCSTGSRGAIPAPGRARLRLTHTSESVESIFTGETCDAVIADPVLSVPGQALPGEEGGRSTDELIDEIEATATPVPAPPPVASAAPSASPDASPSVSPEASPDASPTESTATVAGTGTPLEGTETPIGTGTPTPSVTEGVTLTPTITPSATAPEPTDTPTPTSAAPDPTATPTPTSNPPTATSTSGPPTATATATTVPAFVLSGSISESVANGTIDGLSSSASITVNYATGSISGTLSGAGGASRTFTCAVGNGPVIDSAVVAYTSSYSATLTGSVDPATGSGGGSMTVGGTVSGALTTPFDHPDCTHLNSGQIPGLGSWSGSGTFSGSFTPTGGSLSTSWTAGVASTGGGGALGP